MIWQTCAGCSLHPHGCDVCRAGRLKREAEARIRDLEHEIGERRVMLRRCGQLLAPSPELESCLRALGRIK